jgi:hypothetical protein
MSRTGAYIRKARYAALRVLVEDLAARVEKLEEKSNTQMTGSPGLSDGSNAAQPQKG